MPARFAQMRFDGIQIDMHKGRFSGTFDLEADEADASALNQVLVHVVVSRVVGANPKVTSKGDIERTNVYHVAEMRVVLDAELRDAIVERLGMYSADLSPVPVTVPEPVVAPPAGVDSETGEVTSVPEPVPEPVAASGDQDGPKAARFDPEELEDASPPVDREVVGSVYDKPRDPELERFLTQA